MNNAFFQLVSKTLWKWQTFVRWQEQIKQELLQGSIVFAFQPTGPKGKKKFSTVQQPHTRRSWDLGLNPLSRRNGLLDNQMSHKSCHKYKGQRPFFTDYQIERQVSQWNRLYSALSDFNGDRFADQFGKL